MQRTSPDQVMTIATTAERSMCTLPTTSPVTRSKHMPTALAFLCGCIALLMIGYGIIIPVFPQRLQALGLGAETLALMAGAFALGMFLFSTPMGALANCVGRKPIVLLSLAGFILTNLALALVNAPLLFILIRFLEGALISGLIPASMAMVGDSIPTEKQGRWIGMITTAQAVGIALGPGMGGFLYQAWGTSCPFLISAGIALTASLLALFVLPETLSAHVREKARLQKAKKQPNTPRRTDTSSVSRLVWLFAPLLLIDCGLSFIYPFVLPQYPFFFEKVLKYDAAQYGVIVSAYSLSLAVFALLLGRLSEILSKKLLIILGSLLSSVMNGGMLFLHQYPLLLATAILTGMGSALLLPALGTIYLGATIEQNRSQVMGVRGSALSLGALLGPLTQAAASPWITPEMTFAIGLALSLMMTLFAFVMLKR